jgi:hypothetical protein
LVLAALVMAGWVDDLRPRSFRDSARRDARSPKRTVSAKSARDVR